MQPTPVQKAPEKVQVDTGHSLSWWDLLKLSLRVFRTKPTRTILTILGMSVGIGTVVFLVSLGYGLQDILIGRLLTSEDSLMTLEASYPSEIGKGIDLEQINKTKALEEVDTISPVAEFTGELSIGDGSWCHVGGRKNLVAADELRFRDGDEDAVLTSDFDGEVLLDVLGREKPFALRLL